MDYLKKKQNLEKLNYQNTWINVNQKILNIINEN
jgi:UDP-N-acetylglucosamine--N-acetylmuramyl-(pentapeptide) pyrophosphoryl-undecaprenol N-acetylglucosamine transferase